MLAQDFRLRKKGDFDAVFKRGRSFATPFFSMRSTANTLGHPRIGIVVSNKISKLATVRNKIRRQIRESVRASLPNLPALDIVILAKPTLLKAEFADIKTTVTFALDKITSYSKNRT